MPVNKEVTKSKSQKSTSLENKSRENWESQRIKSERDTFAQRLHKVGSALLCRMGKEWKMKHEISDDLSIVDIRGQVLVEAVRVLTQKKSDENGCALESKVVCLEKQISQLRQQLGKYKRQCRLYEEGLERVLLREDIAYIKDKILRLQTAAVNSERAFNDDLDIRNHSDATEASPLPAKPIAKWPRTTLLSDLNLKLRSFITKELNYEQASGSDWRQLGEQIGISCETITKWTAMKLEDPAGQVLINWIISDPGATVYQLYAHLNSPAMRRIVLCNLISEYYGIT